MKTYVEQKFEESYEVNGEGIDRELYKRIYIDGVKTGIAYLMSIVDGITDEQRIKFRNTNN